MQDAESFFQKLKWVSLGSWILCHGEGTVDGTSRYARSLLGFFCLSCVERLSLRKYLKVRNFNMQLSVQQAFNGGILQEIDQISGSNDGAKTRAPIFNS